MYLASYSCPLIITLAGRLPRDLRPPSKRPPPPRCSLVIHRALEAAYRDDVRRWSAIPRRDITARAARYIVCAVSKSEAVTRREGGGRVCASERDRRIHGGAARTYHIRRAFASPRCHPHTMSVRAHGSLYIHSCVSCHTF